jgi:hypothetical protein
MSDVKSIAGKLRHTIFTIFIGRWATHCDFVTVCVSLLVYTDLRPVKEVCLLCQQTRIPRAAHRNRILRSTGVTVRVRTRIPLLVGIFKANLWNNARYDCILIFFQLNGSELGAVLGDHTSPSLRNCAKLRMRMYYTQPCPANKKDKFRVSEDYFRLPELNLNNPSHWLDDYMTSCVQVSMYIYVVSQYRTTLCWRLKIVMQAPRSAAYAVTVSIKQEHKGCLQNQNSNNELMWSLLWSWETAALLIAFFS